MSLINDVLRELDRRHAPAGERANVPREIRPLPQSVESRPSLRWAFILASLIVVSMVGALIYLFTGTAVDSVVPPQVSNAEAPSAPDIIPQPVESASAVPPAPTFSSDTTDEVTPEPHASPQTGEVAAQKPVGTKSTAEHGEADLPRLKLATELTFPAPSRIESTVNAVKPASAPPPVPVVARATPVPTPTPTPQVAPVPDDWAKAQSLIRGGRSDEAEPLLRRVIEAQPAQLAPRQALIDILLPGRRYSEVMPVLKSGLALFPQQTAWAMNLARLNVDAGDYVAAWGALVIGLPHAQQQADYLAFAGTVLQRLDRSAEAVTHYQSALKLRPDEARWWVGLGIALEASNRQGEARSAFQRAKSLGGFSSEMAKFIEQKLQ